MAVKLRLLAPTDVPPKGECIGPFYNSYPDISDVQQLITKLLWQRFFAWEQRKDGEIHNAIEKQLPAVIEQVKTRAREEFEESLRGITVEGILEELKTNGLPYLREVLTPRELIKDTIQMTNGRKRNVWRIPGWKQEHFLEVHSQGSQVGIRPNCLVTIRKILVDNIEVPFQEIQADRRHVQKGSYTEYTVTRADFDDVLNGRKSWSASIQWAGGR